jgi:hypothetical protein
MHRSDATLVDRVRIRSGGDEKSDHVTLCGTVPRERSRTAVCGVVERFGSPSVARSHIGACRDE